MAKNKILIIKGSARKNGFTNRLCEEIQKYSANGEITVFDTYNESFLPCDGCNFCEKNGRCIKTDLDVFFGEFENADLVIFASPVYNGGFSAPMKALLDRFQVYYTRFYSEGKIQPIKKHRRAILVAAAGRDGKTAFDYMQGQLKCAFSILNTELVGAVLCAHTDTHSTYNETLKELKRSLNDE